MRGKIHRHGLEENAASQVRQTDTDESLKAQAGPSTLDPSSGGGSNCSREGGPVGSTLLDECGPTDGETSQEERRLRQKN